MILENWKHLKCLTTPGFLITAKPYLWENNLVQERECDVRLEAQAAKLYVDFGPTVFLRGCTDTCSWKTGWKEIYRHFFGKESSIFRIHTFKNFLKSCFFVCTRVMWGH